MEKPISVLIGDVEETSHELECNLDRGNGSMANNTLNVVDFGLGPNGASPAIVTTNTEACCHSARAEPLRPGWSRMGRYKPGRGTACLR